MSLCRNYLWNPSRYILHLQLTRRPYLFNLYTQSFMEAKMLSTVGENARGGYCQLSAGDWCVKIGCSDHLNMSDVSHFLKGSNPDHSYDPFCKCDSRIAFLEVRNTSATRTLSVERAGTAADSCCWSESSAVEHTPAHWSLLSRLCLDLSPAPSVDSPPTRTSYSAPSPSTTCVAQNKQTQQR